MLSLDAQIEALLFFKGEPITIKNIAKALSVKEGEVAEAIATLKNKLTDRGLQIVQKEDEIELRTAPSMSELIEAMRKEELVKDLGKAGLETLSIVLYKGPVTRAEIDYVRGVNSTFILRNLLIRDLVERVSNPQDQRSFLYKPTMELLSFLGLRSINELPEFEAVQTELRIFAATPEDEEK